MNENTEKCINEKLMKMISENDKFLKNKIIKS